MTYNTVWLIIKYSLFIVKFPKIYILIGKYAYAEHTHNYRKFEYLGEFLKKMEIPRDPNFLA
jgi:hypothetical protein